MRIRWETTGILNVEVRRKLEVTMVLREIFEVMKEVREILEVTVQVGEILEVTKEVPEGLEELWDFWLFLVLLETITPSSLATSYSQQQSFYGGKVLQIVDLPPKYDNF